MIAAAIIGIANYAIYMATIDYMICAYGPYSASATGGNGWSRDFLAGVLTLPAVPFYESEFIPLTAFVHLTDNNHRHRERRIWEQAPCVCINHSVLHRCALGVRRVRYLLERSQSTRAISLCSAIGSVKHGLRGSETQLYLFGRRSSCIHGLGRKFGRQTTKPCQSSKQPSRQHRRG
jgi:hypothetical protein